MVAYPDPKTKGKPYTVGWGSTRKRDGSPFKMGERITQQEADDLFDYQIQNEFLLQLKKIPYWEEMNDNQRSALLSFAYNNGAYFYGGVGFDTISRNLREKNWSAIPKTLEMYRDPGTNVEAGLLRRRRREGALWLSIG